MLLTIFLLFCIAILLAIIGALVKVLSIQIKKNDIHEAWIISLQTQVETVYKTMKMLDDKQMFSKDDEVGSVFQEMVNLITSLNDMVFKE